MGDHCMVIAGEWTSGDSRWNFAIDKEIMSRIVPVFPGMPLIELQNNVVNEFFTVWLRHLRGQRCGEDRNVTVDNNSVVAMEEMLSLDYRVQVNGKGY
ncbi:hypothetical protein HID58_049025 [Brassica napus]|uniref:Uncharacterized protein n=1 Tax=Brassica napus TaxID=3708 RepID=A0ABQ8B3T8_BRANA|nr:hypothetical protein HID58_049025 [Brassica napus]